MNKIIKISKIETTSKYLYSSESIFKCSIDIRETPKPGLLIFATTNLISVREVPGKRKARDSQKT